MPSSPPNLTRFWPGRLPQALVLDTSGAALIEITLFMPVLVLMAVAIMNFGLGFWYWIEVENAAQVGAQWAIINAAQNGYSSGSIQTAGQDANNASQPSVFTTITVTPALKCGCPSSSGVTLSAWTTSCATGAACSDGSYPGTYVVVTASGTFTPFTNYGSFFPASYPLTSTATVRIQ
jgi:Flp pilus assembly protein TadG